MMLDTMSNRYHMLPSQVLAQATTLDITVLHHALEFHNSANDPNAKKTPPPNEQQMQAMLDSVRNKKVM